jgi:phage-related holin
MLWQPKISQFVLNRLAELIHSGVCFNLRFKEAYMKKVAANVLVFAGIHVSTLQIYNHIRKWSFN